MFFRYLSVLKLVMIKNVKILKIVIIYAFKSKFYQYFVFTTKYSNDLHQFNLWVHVLFIICGKKLVAIEIRVQTETLLCRTEVLNSVETHIR